MCDIRYFKAAYHNYEVAARLMQYYQSDEMYLYDVAYNLQQCVEKTLKAFLECKGVTVPQTHSVRKLLAILLQNREFNTPSGLAREAKGYLISQFTPDYNSYDAIIGYRANDSYFSFAQDFINGTISYSQLGSAMRLGKMGQQFVLKSQKAFDQIRFTGYEIAKSSEWYAKKANRDQSARREYFNTDRNRWQRGELYITQILDEEMGPDDAHLR